MSTSPLAVRWLLLAGIIAAPGCPALRRQLPVTPPPVVFQQPPTLAELLAAVNAQSDRINDLQTDAGRLSIAGYPNLRASLRLERPQRLRLKASFLGNSLLDMGSNEERFWLAMPDSPVLFARHSQFASSAASQVLPVEPTWLVEALGLIHFDPQGPHRGPFQRSDGMIEVHTPVASGGGQQMRVVAIHPQYGYVTEVQLRNAQGQILAVARADRHQHDPSQGVTLPQRVVLELTASQLPIKSFTFEADAYLVNQLQSAGTPDLWMMPPGPAQDLADPRLQLPPLASHGAAVARANNGAFRPEYRGYQR